MDPVTLVPGGIHICWLEMKDADMAGWIAEQNRAGNGPWIVFVQVNTSEVLARLRTKARRVVHLGKW